MVTSPAGTVETSEGAVTRMIGVPTIEVDVPIEDGLGIEVEIADDGWAADDVGEVIAGGVVREGSVAVMLPLPP